MSKLYEAVIRGWLNEEKCFYFICTMKDLHHAGGWGLPELLVQNQWADKAELKL